MSGWPTAWKDSIWMLSNSGGMGAAPELNPGEGVPGWEKRSRRDIVPGKAAGDPIPTEINIRIQGRRIPRELPSDVVWKKWNGTFCPWMWKNSWTDSFHLACSSDECSLY